MTKTIIKIEDIALDSKIEDLQSALVRETRDLQGLLPAWRRQKDLPGTFFGEALGLVEKTDYLKFRDRLKAIINQLALEQKAMAVKMRLPGGSSSAQFHHAYGAWILSQLIEIRRAGKVWSAEQRVMNRPFDEKAA